MSNGKPIKEILPEVIRKLIIQRKHYLREQRINRRKKNRDPNQPPLPGMKQGGKMSKKSKFLERRKKLTTGTWQTIKDRFKKDKKADGGRVKALWKSKAKDYPGVAKVIKLNKLGVYKKPVKKAKGGFVKAAGGTKRVPGSGAATKGTNFEGIF